MITFNTILLQFDEQGEKTGWTYIHIPANLAQQLKPGNKKSFRVKGLLDAFAIQGVALMPMGEGDFIMAVNADMRKGIHKSKGAMLQVVLEADNDYQIEVPPDLQECFDFEPDAEKFFYTLAKSHREYFIKWINSAKTAQTRSKRIENMINAMLRSATFNEMMRALKEEKSKFL